MVRFPGPTRDFPMLKRFQTLTKSLTISYSLVMGGYFHTVKRPKGEAYLHLLPKINNKRNNISIPLYAFMTRTLTLLLSVRLYIMCNKACTLMRNYESVFHF